MCLSTVFQRTEDSAEPREVCANITELHAQGDTLTFTDLLGERYELTGKITEVDFVKSRIYVAS